MDIRIRPAEAADYDALCALIAEVDGLHANELPQIFQRAPGPVRDRATLTAQMADPSEGILLAQAGDHVVGFVHVVLQESPPMPILVPRRSAKVSDLCVNAAFRRCGIGRALMKAAEDWAAARGATALELNVFGFNRGAIDLYHTLGFQMISHRMSKPLWAATLTAAGS